MTITARRYFDGVVSAADEARFYGSLKMRNGTFKSTRSRRFADLDPLILKHAPVLEEGELLILDVAVSGGISTVELAEAFHAAGRECRLTATDLFIEARLLELGGWLTVLTGSDGWLLQYDVAGLAIRPWIRRLDYLTLAVLPSRIARSVIGLPIRERIHAGRGRRVRLVCQRLVEMPGVRLLENDVLRKDKALVEQFHVIRAANILNLSYFTREQLIGGVRNLLSYLQGPGSILVVSRTDEPSHVNNASVFTLDDRRRPVLVERLGTGSEIESLVLHEGTG